jgi:hypothetical protein
MTKLQLFQQVSSEEIYQKFLPAFAGKNKKYKSPFVENDKVPSLHIYEQNGKILYKSHNSGHQGDALQFVADLNRLSCKTELPAVIEIIAQAFSLNGFAGNKKVALKVPPPVEGFREGNLSKNVSISYEKAYTQEFITYFMQFGITSEILEKYEVKQVKFHHFISSKGKVCKFDYRASKQVVVSYVVNGKIKIYIPFIQGKQKKSFGFKEQTSEEIFGRMQLKKCKAIFLVAGEKDCLTAICNGITAVSFQSENVMPTAAQVEDLKKFSSNIYVCYDSDIAGKNASVKICAAYGFANISLSEGFKDIAEYFVSNNKNDFAVLVKNSVIPVPTQPVAIAPVVSVVPAEKIKKIVEPLPSQKVAEPIENIKSTPTPVLQKKGEKVVPPSDVLKEVKKSVEPLPSPLSGEGKGEVKNETVEDFTIFHQCEAYLKKYYKIRFNTIKLELEISHFYEDKYTSLNENDLYVEMNKRGVKVGMDKLVAILRSNYVLHYNPLREYFEGLQKWDEKTDYVKQLASHLKCDNQEVMIEAFRKWCVRAVRSILIQGTYNKQAFIIVHSKQNSGKTTFCRFLLPPALQGYMTENISDDKDSRISIARNFLVNLDELQSLAKHEINSLKSLFSRDFINERLPYERKNSIIYRVASFIGSTNMAEFLTDETGSVRWLCFEIKEIDWNYSKVVDIDKFWSQVVHYVKSGLACDMNTKDIEENEKRNAKFQQKSVAAELIPTLLMPGEEGDNHSEFMNASEILVYMSLWLPASVRINQILIGKAMPSCGFIRVKNNHIDRYGYWCIKLKSNDPTKEISRVLGK